MYMDAGRGSQTHFPKVFRSPQFRGQRRRLRQVGDQYLKILSKYVREMMNVYFLPVVQAKKVILITS